MQRTAVRALHGAARTMLLAALLLLLLLLPTASTSSISGNTTDALESARACFISEQPLTTACAALLTWGATEKSNAATRRMPVRTMFTPGQPLERFWSITLSSRLGITRMVSDHEGRVFVRRNIYIEALARNGTCLWRVTDSDTVLHMQLVAGRVLVVTSVLRAYDAASGRVLSTSQQIPPIFTMFRRGSNVFLSSQSSYVYVYSLVTEDVRIALDTAPSSASMLRVGGGGRYGLLYPTSIGKPGNLVCVDLATYREVWSKESTVTPTTVLVLDSGDFLVTAAVETNPEVGAVRATLQVLSYDTGSPQWSREGSTPWPIPALGYLGDILFCMNGTVWSLSSTDGSIRWQQPHVRFQCFNAPTVTSELIVYYIGENGGGNRTLVGIDERSGEMVLQYSPPEKDQPFWNAAFVLSFNAFGDALVQGTDELTLLTHADMTCDRSPSTCAVDGAPLLRPPIALGRRHVIPFPGQFLAIGANERIVLLKAFMGLSTIAYALDSGAMAWTSDFAPLVNASFAGQCSFLDFVVPFHQGLGVIFAECASVSTSQEDVTIAFVFSTLTGKVVWTTTLVYPLTSVDLNHGLLCATIGASAATSSVHCFDAMTGALKLNASLQNEYSPVYITSNSTILVQDTPSALNVMRVDDGALLVAKPGCVVTTQSASEASIALFCNTSAAAPYLGVFHAGTSLTPVWMRNVSTLPQGVRWSAAMWCPTGQLLVTNSSALLALDAHNGQIAWTASLASLGIPSLGDCTPVALGEWIAFHCAQGFIVTLNATSGAFIDRAWLLPQPVPSASELGAAYLVLSPIGAVAFVGPALSSLVVYAPCPSGTEPQFVAPNPWPTCVSCPPGQRRLEQARCVPCTANEFCPSYSIDGFDPPPLVARIPAAQRYTPHLGATVADDAVWPNTIVHEADRAWDHDQLILGCVGTAVIVFLAGASWYFRHQLRRVPQLFSRQHPKVRMAIENIPTDIIVVRRSPLAALFTFVLLAFAVFMAVGSLVYYERANLRQWSEQQSPITLASTEGITSVPFGLQIVLDLVFRMDGAAERCSSGYVQIVQDAFSHDSFTPTVDVLQPLTSHLGVCRVTLSCTFPCTVQSQSQRQCLQIAHSFNEGAAAGGMGSGLVYYNVSTTLWNSLGKLKQDSTQLVYRPEVGESLFYRHVFQMRGDVTLDRVRNRELITGSTVLFKSALSGATDDSCFGSAKPAFMLHFDISDTYVTFIERKQAFTALFALWFSAVSSAVAVLGFLLNRMEKPLRKRRKAAAMHSIAPGAAANNADVLLLPPQQVGTSTGSQDARASSTGNPYFAL